MKVIKCEMCHLDALTKFYNKVTGYLATHINFHREIMKQVPARRKQ